MPSSAELPDDPAFRARLAAALGAHYEIGDLIGQGGFGRVYRAHDKRLDRRVAIKVIRPDLAGAAAFVKRFRLEGIVVARLRHPAVVPIYEIREADGLIFYAMPFIEGPTLAAKLDQRGPLPPKVAHRIFAELCDAVAATHRAGILHRDIKPANVILEGPHEKVLLTDFGISRLRDGQEVTEGGVFVGTPTYMAPEQFGNGLPDHRSDIYSLGVVGFHLLTGRPPFTGATAAETMMLHVSTQPRPIRSINPSVPMALADAVERCLEKDPADRFESVLELWEQVQRVTFFVDPGTAAPDLPPIVGRASAALAALAALTLSLLWLDTYWISALRLWQLTTIGAGLLVVSVLTSPRLVLEWKRFAARRKRRSFLSREIDPT